MEVICAHGSRMPFDSGRFSLATLFTTLHHVESPALQDQLIADLRRALRPGGIVVGTKGVEMSRRRQLHLGDLYVSVDPVASETRLCAAGLVCAVVEQDKDRFRFLAEASRGNVERQGPDAARGQHISLS